MPGTFRSVPFCATVSMWSASPSLFVAGRPYRPTRHGAIVAAAVPAESGVRDRLRHRELQASQDRVVLRHFELPSHHIHVEQFFVITKQFDIHGILIDEN